MNLKRTLMIALGSAGFLLAQDTAVVRPSIYPPPDREPARALKEYLNLTEAQAQALQNVQKSRQEAEQVIYEQMRQKQLALDSLLQSGSTDYTQIGRLLAEIRDLQKKLPISGEPYRTQALSVLSQEQRLKLPALVDVLKLQTPANDAVFWNLIDRPEQEPEPPIILGGREAADVHILPARK
ncbi:MAG TPA: periplasmic heavy metal sensor [Bryobacteraceae bacterium]|nr:periplasmic heavy metal sensor [Bryobacteraceae bacterium]